MKRVLITDPITAAGLDHLRERGLEVVDLPGAPIDAILREIGTVQGWIIRSGTQIDAELLNQADNLHVIGRAGVGVDNINIEVATLRGVVVMNTPDGNTISAAEHTLALIMALARNVHLGHAKLAAGDWGRHELKGIELKDKTLGIVGLGRIGRQVLQYGLALGMKVIGYDPYAPQDLVHTDEITLDSLDNLLKAADFVTIHVPRNKETTNLIDQRRFKLMKPSARIINCARGGIINEDQLIKALETGEIAGAALDVFTTEPLPAEHPLRSAPNLLLTPHLGASTKEAQEGVSLGICQQVADFLLENKTGNALNLPITDFALMKSMEKQLELAQLMGQIVSQLIGEGLKKVTVTCAGTITESHPLSLAVLTGILSRMVDNRVNFVNADHIAQERGIDHAHGYDSGDTGYANLIKVEVETETGKSSLSGSVFGTDHGRIVEIDGYHLELHPEGVMLFITNQDQPGVLGRIGNCLGAANINIGEALLSRERSAERAFLVVKIDSEPDEKQLQDLLALDGILAVTKVSV